MIKKRCFVIGPIGETGSGTRIVADQLLKHIIGPALEDNSYSYERADFLQNYRDAIPDQISKHVFEDDLVIADLRDHNPNVYYELGKRHAWGGKSILMTDDLHTLPFDVRNIRAIEYDLSNPDSVQSTREELSAAVKAFTRVPEQCPYPLTPDRVIALSRATILVNWEEGRREHYEIAQRLASSECKRIFLMQRSSSLILGPEQNWGAEATFYEAVIKAVDSGTELYHIVSLEGITRHLNRPQSHFPWIDAAMRRLKDSEGRVEITGSQKSFLFRRVPDEQDEEDLKPDRQARTLLVEYHSGAAEGVIVVDLGGRQGYFHLRGPKMKEFFDECMRFYTECPVLLWEELRAVVHTRSQIKP